MYEPNIPLIRTYEDFEDPRARRIAEEMGLNVPQIYNYHKKLSEAKKRLAELVLKSIKTLVSPEESIGVSKDGNAGLQEKIPALLNLAGSSDIEAVCESEDSPNPYRDIIRIYASCAIICYELTKRERFHFAFSKNIAVLPADQKIYFTISDKFILRIAEGQDSLYESEGKHFEDMCLVLIGMQNAHFENLNE